MGVQLTPVGTHGAQVWLDPEKPCRVYGAVGEGVRAWSLRPGLPCDASTGTPLEFVVTAVNTGGGTSTLAVGEEEGYPLVITTDDADFDGINAQLRGESIKIAAGNEIFARMKAKASEEEDSDLLFGVAELKTDLLKTGTSHGITATLVEGVFFFKAAGSTDIYIKSYKDGVAASSVLVGDLGTVDIDLGLHIEGTKVRAYVDDLPVAEFSGTLPDGELTLSYNFRTGAAASATLKIAELAFVAIE